MNNQLEINKLITHPLEHLDYFLEWGGKTWKSQLSYALKHFTGTDLTNKQILDIGTRSGKIACLFALMGGYVKGIDLQKTFLNTANAEASKLSVQERTEFRVYDGDLDIFPDQSFDLIFTKSVLVVVPELENFLLKISKKLKSDGQVVFLENSKGGFLHFFRRFKHKEWNYNQARFWTQQELAIVSEIFDITQVRTTIFPPTYLILGKKKVQNL